MNQAPHAGHATGRPWAIVLAGGDGRRLSHLTQQEYGYRRPKQFCDFGFGDTLLGLTLQRTWRLVPRQRTVVVTTATHRREAGECLDGLSALHRVEQPLNRGTTPGILLPLLTVMAHDPDAVVVILPSDHVIGDEHRFMLRVGEAVGAAYFNDDSVFLLGTRLQEPEDGLGWIITDPTGGSRWPRISIFREKPAPGEAARLYAEGALVNTFVMVARAHTLYGLIRACVPRWTDALHGASGDPRALDAAYRSPSSCLSTDVLQRAPSHQRAVSTGDVGWSDIGTQDRLHRALDHAGQDRRASSEWGFGRSPRLPTLNCPLG